MYILRKNKLLLAYFFANNYLKVRHRRYSLGFVWSLLNPILSMVIISDIVSKVMEIRLSFSIAINVSPEIIIVNELFAGGEIDFKKKAKARIKEIISYARIFICCPHNMDYAR